MICPDMFCIDSFDDTRGAFWLLFLSLMTASLVMGGMGTPTEPQSCEGSPFDATVISKGAVFITGRPSPSSIERQQFFIVQIPFIRWQSFI